MYLLAGLSLFLIMLAKYIMEISVRLSSGGPSVTKFLMFSIGIKRKVHNENLILMLSMLSINFKWDGLEDEYIIIP